MAPEKDRERPSPIPTLDMIETFKLTTNNEGLSPDIFFDKKVERGDPELQRGNVIYKKRNKGKSSKNELFLTKGSKSMEQAYKW